MDEGTSKGHCHSLVREFAGSRRFRALQPVHNLQYNPATNMGGD
jgi:hypothetical protein